MTLPRSRVRLRSHWPEVVRRRGALGLVLSLSFVLIAPSLARGEAPADARILLNQKRMEIGQLIALVSRETGRTILYDDQVRGVVSLVSKRPVTESEAWELLDAALHLIGFALVPSTVDQWRISRVADAVAESPFVERVRSGSERHVTALIPVEVAGLQSVMNVVQPLAGSSVTLVALEQNRSLIASGPETAIARITALVDELDRVEERALRQRVLRYRDVLDVEQMIQVQFESGRFTDRELELWSDERTNSLIFRGSDEATARLRDFLERIDRPAEGEGEIRVLRVLNRDAGEIAEILGGQVPGGGRSRSRAKDDADGNDSGSDARGNNSRSSRDSDARSRDEASDDASRNAPNAAPGDELGVDSGGALENGSANGNASGGAGGSELDLRTLLGGEDYTIAVDPATRSLVVRASERGHRVIRELVERLDASPQLIAVDVTISEVRTPSAWGLSLGYHVPLLPGDSLDEFVGRLISVPSGRGLTSETMTPIAPGALFGRVARDPGIDFEIPGEGGVTVPIQDMGQIDATDIEARIDVLIQPSLILVAGEEHEIFVGSNVPIPVTEVPPLENVDPTNPGVGTFGITVRFNREDIGIRLGLAAQAGREGPIQLDVETEITNIGPSTAGPIEKVGPTLIKEVLTASARLDDGETAILGVDREVQETVAQGGTPFLSDIPFLGWLFKARGKQVDDVRLVIAARARRIATPAELVADSIRRRLAFDRQRAREENLPDASGAPYGVRVTTRSLEADAEAIAQDLETRGHRVVVHPWRGADRRTLFDVYVMGLESLSDAGLLAQQLGEDGWEADLVVFRSRS